MSSGDYVGAVNVLQNPDWGLDQFAGLPGQIIGIEFDADLIPLAGRERVCLHVGPECNNDIIGTEVPVPTPAAVLPILSGMFAAAKRKDKKNEEELA